MGVCGSVEGFPKGDARIPPLLEVNVVGKPGQRELIYGQYALVGMGAETNCPFYVRREVKQILPRVYLYWMHGLWMFSEILWSDQALAYVRSRSKVPLSRHFGELQWLVKEDGTNGFRASGDVHIKEYFPSSVKIRGFHAKHCNGVFDLLGEISHRPFYRQRNSEIVGLSRYSTIMNDIWIYYHDQLKCWLIGTELWSEAGEVLFCTDSLSPITNNVRCSVVKPTFQDSEFIIREFSIRDYDEESESDIAYNLSSQIELTLTGSEADGWLESGTNRRCVGKDCPLNDNELDKVSSKSESPSHGTTEGSGSSEMWTHLL